MKISKILLPAIICVLLSGTTQAQILKPVKWSYAGVKKGANATVLLRATIDPGWHIYSTRQADGGPVKTSISFKSSKDYKTAGILSEPKPLTKFEETFGIQVNYFEKAVTFQQKVALSAPKTAVSGELTYMACNDKQCLPPETIAFNIPCK